VGASSIGVEDMGNELDNGGMLTAEAEDFDRVFTSEVLDVAQKKIRYTTEGKIVREKLGKSLR
jgi:hypothetical protein